jgi:formate dehydrogenase subunit gamma
MGDSPIVRAAALLLAALAWIAASSAQAQDQVPTPAPTVQNSGPEAQVKRQVVQPLNNAPVWRDVNSGEPAVTQVRGRETNVLIESRGEAWRQMRGPLVFWGAMLVALGIAGLAVFYLIRGPLDLPDDEKRGGRLIERFTPMDRYAHWLLAIAWVTLAITGLILSLGRPVLLPVIGYTVFSWLATLAKAVHNFVGPVLIIAVPWVFIRYIRDNGIGVDDIKWFLNIRGYFQGHEHPSGRFNAGEKTVFWGLLLVLSTILVCSGLWLLFPNFDQTRATMQVANMVHTATAYLAIAFSLVHMYLGTLGMRGAYAAMRYGYVDESWAKHHHLRWYQDVVAGRSRQHFADAEAEPPARGQPRTRPA